MLNDGYDASLKLKKQIAWTKEIKEAVWTEIVREKILMQALLLEELGKSESNMLFGYIRELAPGDATNREGHAAKVYFNALFGTRLFAICGLHALLEKNELAELYRFAFLKKYDILSIESLAFESLECEKKYIIDSDLCSVY